MAFGDEKKKKAKKEKAPVEPVTIDWDRVMDDLQSGGSSDFIFCKQDRTRLRLVQKEGQPAFTTIPSTYQGRTKDKYMILAVDMAVDEGERTVRGVILSKTPFKAIVQLLQEGYDFFDPEEGFGVTVRRSGSGLDTQYAVMPSQKPLPMDPEWIEENSPTFDDLKEKYAEMSARRSGDGDSDEKSGDW